MSTVTVTQNDIGVTFTGTCVLTTVADWTGATVRFIIKHKSSYAAYSGTGSITGYGTGSVGSSTTGEVSYTTAAADLAEYGKYDHEWEVTFANGNKITFPSTGTTINVRQELG